MEIFALYVYWLCGLNKPPTDVSRFQIQQYLWWWNYSTLGTSKVNNKSQYVSTYLSLTKEKLVPQSVQRLTSMVQCLKACSTQTHDFRSVLPTFSPALISLRSKHSSVDMYLTELTDKLAHSLTHECKVSTPVNPTLIHPYPVRKTNHLPEISDYRHILSYGLVF
jgi:hypothetical protein